MTVVSGFSECFQIQIINDEISEHVESFRLHLAEISGAALTFVNKSITIVIVDEGMYLVFNHSFYAQSSIKHFKCIVKF